MVPTVVLKKRVYFLFNFVSTTNKGWEPHSNQLFSNAYICCIDNSWVGGVLFTKFLTPKQPQVNASNYFH